MLVESTIKAALRNAPCSGKKIIELKDDGARGEGRLSLQIRVAKPRGGDETSGRVTSEWYAVFYRRGRRAMAKIGTYPTLGLAEARKTFREDYLPVISKGEAPEGKKPQAKLGRTVLDLFTAYVAHLESQGKSVTAPRHYLLGSPNDPKGRFKGKKLRSAAKVIGETRLAADILPEDIIPYLHSIHARGAKVSAINARCYISAAFGFGIKSANSYHQPAGAVAWGLKINPVSAIPMDPDAVKAGHRHLTPAEFRDLWNWLETCWERRAAAPALQLCMATGQRPGELLRLGRGTEAAEAYTKLHGPAAGSLGLYNANEKTIFWSTTKNKQPHLLPIAPQAADVVARLMVNTAGLYFPRPANQKRALSVGAAGHLINAYLKAHPKVPHFTPRDLRRTWKTLAGAAGLSKDIRDRLQNHAENDVSSRHYDRYEYLAEKRAAVKTWGEYLGRVLAGDIDNPILSVTGAEVFSPSAAAARAN